MQESFNKTRMVNEKFKSLFWSYFSPTEPNRAKCNVCYLEFSYAGGSTSNLARHLRTKHPEINLNSQSEYRYQESQAATIIITTQTSSDGECIATIEPFNIIPKEVVKEECLADNHTDYDDGDQRISSIEEVMKEEGLTDNHVHLEDSDQRISSLEDQVQSQTENVRHLRKRSLCWSIFKKLDSGKVLCSYCNKVLALPNGNTSNLKRHVRLKHPGVHFSLQAEEIERRKTLRPITRPRFDRVSKSSISYFSVTEESQMPQDMLRLMEETREKLGFVPNVYQALSHRPNEMRAYVTYYETLMEERMGSHLSQSDKEMISIAVSAANKCTYFIIAHSAYFRLCSHNRILADQIAANWETADLDDRQKSILQFAMKLTKCEQLTERDFGNLQNYGLDREDAWDIGALVSFCSLSNRMAFLANMMPNEEFYNLGRESQSEN